jgi:NAD(P)-dependent dehydrogenase (short-subunit alcohol dehydrogenase family)
MSKELAGTVAVIVGMGPGSGLTTAMEFAFRGVSAVIGIDPDGIAARCPINIMAELDVEYFPVVAKTDEIPALKKIAADVVDMRGRVDIVVNNIDMTRKGFVQPALPERWDDLRLSVSRSFCMIHELAKAVMRSPNGRIMNIVMARSADTKPNGFETVSDSMGVLATYLHREYRKSGVTANTLCADEPEAEWDLAKLAGNLAMRSEDAVSGRTFYVYPSQLGA